MLEDPNLVKFKKDQMVNITSFYFSAHPDFMEGKVKLFDKMSIGPFVLNKC